MIERTRLVVAGVLVAFSFAQARASSSNCAAGDSPRLASYLETLDGYRDSANDGRAPELRRLSLATIANVIHELGVPSADGTATISDDCLQAAAIMHTELAMADEQSSEHQTSAVHWRAARSLIDRMHDVGRRELVRRDWLLMVAYYFQATIFSGNTRAGFDRSRHYFDEAVTLYPDDADVLVSAGALYEWNGAALRGTRKDSTTAEALYRRAVRADPRGAEAWLRLGRTLLKHGSYAEAEARLRTALEIHESDVLDYFAHLFLGRLADRADRFGDSSEHYRAATRLLPHWQVAYIALAHTLRRLGRREQAHATIARAVTLRPPFAQLDGWWVYERGRCGRWKPLLRELRERVAR